MIIKVKNDNNITFPQANDIYKLIRYMDEKTYNSHLTYLKRVDLDYVKRQNSYYKSAAVYLGLIEKNTTTSLAKHIFQLDKNYLFISFVALILQNKIFKNFYIERNIKKTAEEIRVDYNLKESTALRRANTVKSWITWCDVIIGENKLDIKFI